MSASKNIDKICIIITVMTLILTFVFCNGQSFGIKIADHAIGYENRIFDDSKVHTLDIEMDNWGDFLKDCESEEYALCNISIDGELIRNAAIRAKGNTSLSSVKAMKSSRYSFKIEFDHYDKSSSYHGLDKLCLNNIIQDNTYMKDYLAYKLMNEFSVDSPLCSYVYITVNGKEWGLYLAVEAIEDSFLKRNYGNDPGELYKPDSINFGGGPGNGKNFDFSKFSESEENSEKDQVQSGSDSTPDHHNGGSSQHNRTDMPEKFDPSQMFGDNRDRFGGMGRNDVKLKYTDDSFESYSNIFNNAKTKITDDDKTRLIKSLKLLGNYENIESVVNTEEVLRYFVVHNYLVNGDSYTGQMVHNYYLYEKDGQFSMIPWDYNLAYGTFQFVSFSPVNNPIDSPVTGNPENRPMIGWIFSDEKYTEEYHKLFNEFVSETDIQFLIKKTAEMIYEYVSKDPTKFCTYDDFRKGVLAISEFCRLRTESTKGQLNGSVPSTLEGQNNHSSALIDDSSLNYADMGSINNGGGFGGAAPFPPMPGGPFPGGPATVPPMPGAPLPGGAVPVPPIPGGPMPGVAVPVPPMPGGPVPGGTVPVPPIQGGPAPVPVMYDVPMP